MSARAKPMALTRAVTREECDWLEADLQEGETVFEFDGHTYGCIGPSGIAVSRVPNEMPFFELPLDAVAYADPSVPATNT